MGIALMCVGVTMLFVILCFLIAFAVYKIKEKRMQTAINNLNTINNTDNKIKDCASASVIDVHFDDEKMDELPALTSTPTSPPISIKVSNSLSTIKDQLAKLTPNSS